MAPQTLYILDGSAYIFRAFYANPNMQTSGGYPTSALMGFTAMLRKILRDNKPDHIVVALDTSRQTFRTEIYPEYKANRSAPPPELKTQIPRVRELVEAMNISILQERGVEADDLIASAVRKFSSEDLSIVICSADKDLMQLLGDGVTMLDSMRDRIYGVDDVVARFQVSPTQVLDVLALAGDSSDNIPGVPGIGEKTAGALIKEFGDLETLLASVDKVSGKKRKENLKNFADQARLSRDLVRLKEDCEIPFSLQEMEIGPPDHDKLEALFKEFEFSRFLRQLREERDQNRAQEPLVEPTRHYTSVCSEAELAKAVEAITEQKLFSFDLETTSRNPLKAQAIGLSLAWREHEAVYIPIGHRYIGAPRQLSLETVLKHVGPLLSSTQIQTVCHNFKYEHMVLKELGVELDALVCDTMLASYLVDPNRLSHSLDALTTDLLRQSRTTYQDVVGRGQKKIAFDMADVEAATRHSAQNADVTLQLYKLLWPQLEQSELVELHDEVELPLTLVLAAMERAGITINIQALAEINEKLTAELSTIEAKAHEMVGEPFNLNSPKQLRKILFEDLGLKSKKRTKSGLSTDHSVLEKLSSEHPLPATILEHRTLAKLRSTYVEALPQLADEHGRVHTNFNQAVAATGRLSSSEPNLQNIPIRTARGREIRRAFVPRQGCVLLSADYSQVELRLLAHISGDKAMISSFKSGDDIHRRTAAEVFGTEPLFVTPDMRRTGKTLNFGIVYGMGAVRMARDLGIKRDEAAAYIKKYFERYEGVRKCFDSLVNSAQSKGYAQTMYGRRRPIPELNSYRNNIRALGERLAINTPIQGSAADLIKVAMIRIQHRIEAEKWPATMLLQVHDELVFEVEHEAAGEFQKLVNQEMSQATKLKVPLVVDTARGQSWLEAK